MSNSFELDSMNCLNLDLSEPDIQKLLESNDMSNFLASDSIDLDESNQIFGNQSFENLQKNQNQTSLNNIQQVSALFDSNEQAQTTPIQVQPTCMKTNNTVSVAVPVHDQNQVNNCSNVPFPRTSNHQSFNPSLDNLQKNQNQTSKNNIQQVSVLCDSNGQTQAAPVQSQPTFMNRYTVSAVVPVHDQNQVNNCSNVSLPTTSNHQSYNSDINKQTAECKKRGRKPKSISNMDDSKKDPNKIKMGGSWVDKGSDKYKANRQKNNESLKKYREKKNLEINNLKLELNSSRRESICIKNMNDYLYKYSIDKDPTSKKEIDFKLNQIKNSTKQTLNNQNYIPKSIENQSISNSIIIEDNGYREQDQQGPDSIPAQLSTPTTLVGNMQVIPIASFN